jgi:hypothetical protein
VTDPIQSADIPRRSTRVRWEVPVRITGADEAGPFAEEAQTLVVNPQGCGVRMGRAVEAGSAVHLQGLPKPGSVSAQVASCVPVGIGSKLFLVGLALDEPGNIWGVPSPPADWGMPAAKAAAAAASAGNADARSRENWPFTQFSRKGEFHPGRK